MSKLYGLKLAIVCRMSCSTHANPDDLRIPARMVEIAIRSNARCGIRPSPSIVDVKSFVQVLGYDDMKQLLMVSGSRGSECDATDGNAEDFVENASSHCPKDAAFTVASITAMTQLRFRPEIRSAQMSYR